MMDFLLGDVGKNRFPGRLADRKSTVAALPAESVMALAFYDSGRAGFEILDQFGEGDLSRESTKNMDMIFHPASVTRTTLVKLRNRFAVRRLRANTPTRRHVSPLASSPERLRVLIAARNDSLIVFGACRTKCEAVTPAVKTDKALELYAR